MTPPAVVPRGQPEPKVCGIDVLLPDQVDVPLTRTEVSILSPLRYPGSKRRLAGYVSETLRLNRMRPRVFVEPFAGGASVALQLLNDDVVERIALGERDAGVASFWKIVFQEPDWLIDAISHTPVTVETWRAFHGTPGQTDRERALRCLFLNRTSFSGILNRRAGPIGGQRQANRYTIDCRFALATVERRIRQAARLKDRVLLVHPGTWRETLAEVEQRVGASGGIFYYLDPPFFEKADRLYTHWFDLADHQELHDALVHTKYPWLLSYDPAPAVIAMYKKGGHGVRHIDSLYSASGSTGPAKAREIVITNLNVVPAATRLWRSSSEWRPPGRDAPTALAAAMG